MSVTWKVVCVPGIAVLAPAPGNIELFASNQTLSGKAPAVGIDPLEISAKTETVMR
jgi:hypothetical protein